MSTRPLSHQLTNKSVFKRYHTYTHFSEFLPTRRRQKSTGTDMEQNHVTVTPCTRQLRQLYAWEPARWQCCACGVPPDRPRCPAARDPEWGTRASSPRDRRAAWTAGARSDTCAAQRRPWSQYDFHKPDTPCTRHTHTHTRLTALCPWLPGWAGKGKR